MTTPTGNDDASTEGELAANKFSEFLKNNNNSKERERLHFEKLFLECPDLAKRVILIRSRVKILKSHFRKDSKIARDLFNYVTIITMIISVTLILAEIIIPIKYPSLKLEQTNIAIGALVGIFGAAVSTFGLHKRYHALFRARWSMASLELQIDSFLHNFVLDMQDAALKAKDEEKQTDGQKLKLTDENREQLSRAIERWLVQIDTTLHTFGDTYGGAMSSINTGIISQLGAGRNSKEKETEK